MSVPDSPPVPVGVLTSSASRRAGGVFDAGRNLSSALAGARRYAVRVFTMRDADTERDRSEWADVPVEVFNPAGPRSLSFAPGLLPALRAYEPSIVHVHGLWMYPSIAALRWAGGGRPYIVSPHGMLDPWALANSRWKKRVAGFAYEDRHLRGAKCLHALNTAEASAFRSYGLRNPICVIPNGVPLPGPAPDTPAPWEGRIAPDSRVLFYLGRLHPKKGLDTLLEAWAQVEREAIDANWSLVVGGWDQGGHEAQLRMRSSSLGLEKTVHFIGPQYGGAKSAGFHHANAFILPSLSEGLPMTVLEAWAHELPVLMTAHCNLPQGFEAGAALAMDANAASIADQLRRLFSMSGPDCMEMGKRGRALVEREHQWPAIAAKMSAVYDWALDRGPMPDCVMN
ncbi:MAG: glycosyltransferase [Acidobacteria bacterium]|nr:glycosyltransferase [Acidobacteriota bacterium]